MPIIKNKEALEKVLREALVNRKEIKKMKHLEILEDMHLLVEELMDPHDFMSPSWNEDLLIVYAFLLRMHPEYRIQIISDRNFEDIQCFLEHHGTEMVKSCLPLVVPDGWIQDAERLKNSYETEVLMTPLERKQLAEDLLTYIDQSELFIVMADRFNIDVGEQYILQLSTCIEFIFDNADAFLSAQHFIVELFGVFNKDIKEDLLYTYLKFLPLLSAIEEMEKELNYGNFPEVP